MQTQVLTFTTCAVLAHSLFILLWVSRTQHRQYISSKKYVDTLVYFKKATRVSVPFYLFIFILVVFALDFNAIYVSIWIIAFLSCYALIWLNLVIWDKVRKKGGGKSKQTWR